MNAVLQSEAGKAQSRGWPTVPLGEIVDVLDSKRKPITKRDRTSGPYPYYGATGVLDWVGGFLFDEPLVLVGEDGAKWGAGDKSAFPISGKTWVNNHAHALRPHRDKVIDDWLVYFLNATDLSDFISGMTVPKLNQGQLREIPIPLAPLVDQKRIVAVLDQAFAALDRARAHAAANLADAEDLFVGQREALVKGNGKSWAALTVEDVCERFEYGTSTKSLPEGRVPVLRMGNMQSGEIDWSSLKYTDDDDDIRKLMLQAGDVLFNRTNSVEHVGKTAIYRGEHPAIFAGYLVRLHVRKSVITPEYLNIFLNSNAAREYGRSVMGKSVNQANISASKLKTYPIEVPSLAEQKDIVESLLCIRKQTRTLVKAYETKLADIATLRQSLLQKAFSGELT